MNKVDLNATALHIKAVHTLKVGYQCSFTLLLTVMAVKRLIQKRKKFKVIVKTGQFFDIAN